MENIFLTRNKSFRQVAKALEKCLAKCKLVTKNECREANVEPEAEKVESISYKEKIICIYGQ